MVEGKTYLREDPEKGRIIKVTIYKGDDGKVSGIAREYYVNNPVGAQGKINSYGWMGQNISMTLLYKEYFDPNEDLTRFWVAYNTEYGYINDILSHLMPNVLPSTNTIQRHNLETLSKTANLIDRGQ